MTTFSDFMDRYPYDVMKIALQECIDEQRPVFHIDEPSDWDIVRGFTCEYCDRHVEFLIKPYHSWGGGKFYPDTSEEHTCDTPFCIDLYAYWHMNGKVGNRRRSAFKNWSGMKFWETNRFGAELRMLWHLAGRLYVEALDKEIEIHGRRKDRANRRRAA